MVPATRAQPLSVLYLEHSPILQARFVRSVFARRPKTELRFRMLFTGGEGKRVKPQLGDADVVLLGDVRRAYFAKHPAFEEQLVRFVQERGGSLIFLARTRDDLPAKIRALQPVDFGRARTTPVKAHRPVLTRRGLAAPHLRLELDREANATLWQRRFEPMRDVGLPAKARAHARVFVTARPHGAQAEPEVFVCRRTQGKGDCFFVGMLGTWRWRKNFGSRYFDRFWIQLVRHAAAS